MPTYSGHRLERVRASAQWAGSGFQNSTGVGVGIKGGPLPLMRDAMRDRQARTPPRPLPLDRPHDAWRAPVRSGLRVTWLGHSTVLLELDGLRLLTDPVFGDRASPLSFAGPKRFHPVPAALSELPPLDAVVLSHDHYDHLCAVTMTALATQTVPIVTSLGVGARLEAMGVAPDRIRELDWKEHTDIGGLRITATPAQHFSGRGPTDRNKTLWSSWVFQTAHHRVFFSGDTGLTPQFRDIGAQHGPFDLVMLEIGAFHTSWAGVHLGPAYALDAFAMLGSGTLLPVHWATFSLGLHAWDAPGEEIVELAALRGARVLTPRLGQVFEPDDLDGPTPWWRAVARG